MEKKHTIIICCNAYPPNFIGGAEIVAHNQSKSLIKAGHNVIVFAAETYSNNKLYTCYRDDYDNVKVYRIRMGESNFNYNYINFFNQSVNEELEKIIDNNNADILHCHNIIGLSLGIIDVAKHKGLKVIMTLHDSWGYCFKNTRLKDENTLCLDSSQCSDCMPYLLGNSMHIPIRFRQDYFNYMLKKVDSFISPSAYLAKSYVNSGIILKEKMNVVWNGTDVEKYIKIINKTSNLIRFTYVGYFGKHKGIMTILEAINRTKYKDKIQLNLVGDGEEKNNYINYIEKNNLSKHVRFWGKIPNDKIINVYEETDVYVIASIWPENQPVSIVEAMICGKPVIASNLGGNTELVKNNLTGFLFEAGNSSDLEEKINYFVENKNEISEYGENGKNIMKKYSYDIQVKKIVDLYENINIIKNNESKLKIAIDDINIPDNIYNCFNDNIELYLLDWINKDDIIKMDIIVLTKEKSNLMDYFNTGVCLIISDHLNYIKKLVILNKCGIYYKNTENMCMYISYLIKNSSILKKIKLNNKSIHLS